MEQHQPISRYSLRQTVNYRGEQVQLHPDEEESIRDDKTSKHKKTYIKSKQKPLYKQIFENKTRVSNTSSLSGVVNEKLLNYTVSRCKERNKLFKKAHFQNIMPSETGKLKQTQSIEKQSKNIKQAIDEFIGMSLFRSRKRLDKNKKVQKDSLKTQIFKIMLRDFNERQIQQTNQEQLLSLYKDLSDGLKMDTLSLIKHKQIPIITKYQKERLAQTAELASKYNSINQIMDKQDRFTVPLRVSTDRQKTQHHKIIPQNCFKHLIEIKQNRPVKLSLHQASKYQKPRRQLSIFSKTSKNQKYCRIRQLAPICQYFDYKHLKQSAYKIQEQLDKNSNLWINSKKWTPLSLPIQQKIIQDNFRSMLQFQTNNSLISKRLSFLNCLIKINSRILQNLFSPRLQHEIGKKCVYSIWLFLDNVFRQIKVSQWFPLKQSFLKKQLVHQYTIEYLSNLKLYPQQSFSNLWFHILMKCFAIYYKNYETFFTLNSGEVIKCLMGIECSYKTRKQFSTPVEWKIYVIKNIQLNQNVIIFCGNAYYIIKQIDTIVKKNTIKLQKIGLENTNNQQYLIPFSEVYKNFQQIVIIPSETHFFYSFIYFKVSNKNVILLSHLQCQKQISFYLQCPKQVDLVLIFKIFVNKNSNKKNFLTLISSTKGSTHGVLKKGCYKIFYLKGSVGQLLNFFRNNQQSIPYQQTQQITLPMTCVSSSPVQFFRQSSIKKYEKYFLQNQQNYFYMQSSQKNSHKYS